MAKSKQMNRSPKKFKEIMNIPKNMGPITRQKTLVAVQIIKETEERERVIKDLKNKLRNGVRKLIGTMGETLKKDPKAVKEMMKVDVSPVKTTDVKIAIRDVKQIG